MTPWLARAGALLALLLLPLVLPQYVLHVLVFILIYTLPVIGLGFLTGFTGRVSLAQGALFGVGAYTTALLTTRLGWSPLAALLPSIVVTVALALAIGGAVVRLAGLYFVMATIGIQQIVSITLMNWIDLTGGPQGVRSIPAVSIGAWELDSTRSFYFLALLFAVVSYVLARRVIASRLGLYLRALSDDALAADAVAVKVTRAKVTALALSAAWAGAGGFLYAHYVRYVHPDMFGLEPSVLFLVMSMFGGYRSLAGMILATAVLESATEYLRPFGEYRMIAYGVILLAGMMYFPKGILTLFQRKRREPAAEVALGAEGTA
ncbi:branched-chain amino acid ABC transporter permease [Ramlibacter sp. AN1133]|uniref:branched-chain amino acid ABC transporter permease n=1 Tax=Ramlibacter sp. AN1133 TaxID=3133429 RepID=UPI0030C37A31